MSDSSGSVGDSPLRRLTGVQILGTGSFVPDQVVTNADLGRLGCDPDWIVQRTGIRERRHLPATMTTSDMAIEAARRALAAADVPARDVDLLVIGTFSPDRLAPAMATRVQHELGLKCGAFDVSAACAGFAYALTTAMQFVATGCSRRALVIGADANSRIIDPDDKNIYPLFGDGAGAVLLSAGSDEQGALAYTIGADGSCVDLLTRPVGGAEHPQMITGGQLDRRWYLQMEGRPVFKWAVRLVDESVRKTLDHAGLSPEQIDCWLFHQANVRILDAAVDALGISRERVVMHMDRYGNTSAASIPIALDETVRAGGVKHGDHLVLCGFGAGLAWGTIAWRW